MFHYATLIISFFLLFQVIYSLPAKYSNDDLERLLRDLLREERKNEHNNEKSHGRKGKQRLKLEDIEKSELNLHSLAQDYAERQLDYLPDGAHKPRNMNKKEKEEELALDRDVHKMSDNLRIPNRSAKRTFYHDKGWRWPNRTIHYVIDYPSFDPYQTQAEDKIKSSLALFEDAACIHWVEVTEATTTNNYIKFFGNTTSCASYVGYIGRTEQKIWLGPGCLWTSIVLHEVLHALGAWHEQQRTDREENICVLFENIKPGAVGNFERQHIHEYAPYNLGSVLQYGLSSFAKQSGLQTMQLPDNDLAYLITNSKDDLSFYDKLNVNMYYDCPATCSLTCNNGGFAKMNYLGVCSCECPDGLTGSDCSELDTSNNCGGIIDLTSPGSSQYVEMTSYTTNLLCTWLIKAPLKTTVRATIEYLDLPDSSNNNCLHFLIFKDYLIGEPGKQACGNTPGAVYSKHLLGDENMMMIRFDSVTFPQVSPGTGFRVKVEAIPSGCYSHPCKFGATCHEGTSVDQYTCSCPEGFSGQNCDYVTADATVRSTFDKDYTGSIFQQDPTSQFWWSLVSQKNFDGTTVYPHSGTLFATMVPYLTVFYLYYQTKLRTEATFEATERCLNITYIMDNQTNPSYPQYYTKLIVTVLDGESLLNEYTIAGGTDIIWRSTLVDLPAVNNLKVEVTGVYGWNTFGMDDLLILPSACDCVNHQCVNGQCIPSNETYTCQCDAGYSGNYCEITDAVDGGYTEWTAWSTCTNSCGGGIQSRTRTCTNPPPQNGGADCVGESTQTQSCNTQGCPIDGGFTAWSEWGQCSISCGDGTQTRSRSCTNPSPQNGGADCVGETSQTQSCNLQSCSIDGGYTEWSAWSTCLASCGGGTQTRTRTCTNPAPQNGGADCVGESSQTQSCNDILCPIDGGYTEWSVWGACSVTCGDGVQTRTRTCTNPAPAHGGADCVGENSQTQSCTASACPVDGGYTNWSAWSTCTVSCGGGTQTRTRTCTNPAPQNGGAGCVGSNSETQSCNNVLCPIDGGYTEWSVWSSCSVSCGEGVQTRTRTCTNPAPQNGGADCVGEDSQTQSCTEGSCPINGGFTNWSVWSTCTVSCGGGTRTRTRTCTNPVPANGGADCVGDRSQTENCNTQECPINGGYTEWSVWSTCTVSCGGGTQTRTRTCTNPEPSNGGADCVGESSQTQDCNTAGCPITSSNCDFEEEIETNCFLKEGTDDDFDWTRQSGGTDTRRTGPGLAYSGYYYKYIEANGKEPYSTAELVSNGVFADATYCFEFYNHMKGNQIGSLEVITVESGIENVIVRLDTSRKGWERYYTTLQLNGQTQLIIRGTRGSGNKGDIAVDNVSISIC